MRAIFTLTRGDCDVAPNMDSWIITSDEAMAEESDPWLVMLKGDRIDHNGDVWRKTEDNRWSECVGNVSL